MHVSALLLCAACWPVIFWARDNLNFDIALIVTTGTICLYNFVRQTIFLSKHQNYVKSKKRFLLESISVACCFIFAAVIAAVQLCNHFKSFAIAAFWIIKVYYVLYVFLTFIALISSADRMMKILTKAEKGELWEIETTNNLSIFSLVGAFLSGASSMTILCSGVNNFVFYFLSLPLSVSAVIAFLFYIMNVKKMGFINHQTKYRDITGFACLIISITLSCVFTCAKVSVEYDKVTVEPNIYTFVLLAVIVLNISAFICFFRKNKDEKANKDNSNDESSSDSDKEENKKENYNETNER